MLLLYRWQGCRIICIGHHLSLRLPSNRPYIWDGMGGHQHIFSKVLSWILAETFLKDELCLKNFITSQTFINLPDKRNECSMLQIPLIMRKYWKLNGREKWETTKKNDQEKSRGEEVGECLGVILKLNLCQSSQSPLPHFSLKVLASQPMNQFCNRISHQLLVWSIKYYYYK